MIHKLVTILVIAALAASLRGGSEPPAQGVQYRYDADGRLTSVTEGGVAIRYTYDAAGSVLRRQVGTVGIDDAR